MTHLGRLKRMLCRTIPQFTAALEAYSSARADHRVAVRVPDMSRLTEIEALRQVMRIYRQAECLRRRLLTLRRLVAQEQGRPMGVAA